MKKIIEQMKKMNKLALTNGDIPVSCVIIKDNTIISSGYNRRVKDNDPLQHAEIIAIKRASKKLKTYNLKDCELYTTLKPCRMCEEVIKESRIKNVHYILDKKKDVNNKISYHQISDDYNYFLDEIQGFFRDKR